MNLTKTLFALLLLAFLVVYHLWGYLGHFGYDDMYYARFANDLAQGKLALGIDHFAYRLGIVAPVALFYKLLGVSDTASALPAMGMSGLTGLLILYFCRRYNATVACLALALWMLAHWVLFYADKIMPDVPVALAFTAALAAIYRYRFEQQQKAVRYALGLAICLLFGYLAKESIWLTVPVFGYIALSDVAQKKHLRFWGYSALFGGLLLVLNFGYIWIETGNPLQRFVAIQANSYFMPTCSYEVLPLSATLKRIGYELWQVFVGGGMALGIIVLPLAWYKIGKVRLFTIPDPQAFATVTATIAALSANFMTTSFSVYKPLCADPRHYLFFMPIAAIASAPFWYAYLYAGAHKLYFLLAILGLCAVSYVSGFEINNYLYLPLLVLCVVRYFLPNISADTHATTPETPLMVARVCVFVFIATLFAYPIQYMAYARSVHYDRQKHFVWDYFKNKPEKNVIVTNEVQRNLSQYYCSFDTTQHRFITYKEAENYTFVPQQAVYLFLNGYTQYLCGTPWDKLPKYVQQPPASFEKVFDETSSGLSVYKIHHLEELKKKE